MKKYENITAFILAGGLSSRMGTNKALLQLGGKSLIQIFIDLLDPLFVEVEISSNEPQLFHFTNKEIIKDLIPGRGPLGGIHSALTFTTSDRNLIISCDMPFINKELINYLCNYKSEKISSFRKQKENSALCRIYSNKIFPS
jgi:molybdopterin-guanine dinucleotide biosynthesis protein A